MKSLNLKMRLLTILCLILASSYGFCQEGNIVINQDKHIPVLLDLKKEMNKNETSSDRFKIQIYSGNRSGAYAAQKEFKSTIGVWSSTDTFEPPNFKIWIGNFRTRLEADRALKKVKKKFPNAFIFKPKKK